MSTHIAVVIAARRAEAEAASAVAAAFARTTDEFRAASAAYAAARTARESAVSAAEQIEYAALCAEGRVAARRTSDNRMTVASAKCLAHDRVMAAAERTA